MDKINLKMQWYLSLYKFYDGLARMFLQMEQKYIHDPKKFWPLSDRFEKYHKKACLSYDIYMKERKRVEACV